MEKQTIIFRDLGLKPYQESWDYQEQLLQKNVKIKSGDSFVLAEASGQRLEETASLVVPGLSTEHYLLFVEHPPVFTLGKSGDMGNVLLSEELLRANGIEFFKTNRGGDITFHGPGQIVAYPILDLEKFDTDIGHYLRNLEELVILTLAEYGIVGGRSAGETGVWIEPGIKGKERKICAIGVRCSRWITMHGLAFNINTDLNYFNYIIPCGIPDKQVTSLERELGRKVDMEEAKLRVKRNFEKVFGGRLVG